MATFSNIENSQSEYFRESFSLVIIVYIDQSLHTNAYQHYLTTGICNSFFMDEGLLCIDHFSQLWSVSENAHNS